MVGHLILAQVAEVRILDPELFVALFSLVEFGAAFLKGLMPMARRQRRAELGVHAPRY